MKYVRRAIVLRVLYLSMFFLSMVYADERILEWKSDITIHDDSSMTVIEQLTFNVENRQIRHGIMREFPTKYRDEHGLNYHVGFQVLDVQQDGKSVPFKIVDYMNGKRLFIGDPDIVVSPGVHVYNIMYTTNRQLGFFKDYDELYWNVTGLGWPFFINKVVVAVHLTQQATAKTLHAQGYTGAFTSTGHDYRVTRMSDGFVEFETMRVLNPHEGLTIVVSWPKGIIVQPSYFWYYVRDNIHLFILLLTLLALLFFYLWAYHKTRASIKKGTIIPLFYPPRQAGPGALNYVLTMKYDNKQLAATIVDLAVKGLLLIEQVPGGWLSSMYYVLKKRTDIDIKESSHIPETDIKLTNILFGSQKQLNLNQNQETVTRAASFLQRSFEHDYDIPYFQSNSQYVSFAVIASACIVVLAAFIASDAYLSLWFWILVGLQCFLHFLFYQVLPYYTQEGQKFKEEIEGFKLFLTTTETERLKVIGTPPTKTPQLYETYLPYAIALGVEQQWSNQFVPVFKHLQESGQTYQPQWYYAGHSFTAIDLAFLSASFSSSFSNGVSSSMRPIPSSISRPGSTSGSGGGGYSGGGGGGGGGSGW